MSVLERIVESTQKQVKKRKKKVSLSDLERLLAEREHHDDRPFSEALTRPGVSVIAEHKRASPSAGTIRDGATVEEIVTAYERGGAAALSILTEGPHFQGHLDDLRAAQAACGLPILRKDFIVDRYQLVESAVAGADAILLIVAALSEKELEMLYAEAYELDLAVLVEVHDEDELKTALEVVDADIIGINNRNLVDFSVDLETTFELLADVPTGKTVVSESGIHHREQLEDLERVGVDAVLVGESLMRAPDPEAALNELLGHQGEDDLV
ncbi:MAG: indole-3-glycerol phosphate synthase TrpC [Solirubrobacterales bacterium]|nr:indole-3-glycerol phosphate synthase TrpC [Solirubrobacterales bacterium]